MKAEDLKPITFAKLIETDNGQVLLQKSGELEIEISAKYEIEDQVVTPIVTAGYDSEEDRNKKFDSYNEEKASIFLKGIINEILKSI